MDKAKARMFENRLHPRYKNFISSQYLTILIVVVDFVKVVERNKLVEQKAKKVIKTKIDARGKDKNPSQ